MKTKKKYPYPTRAVDVPVTQNMLYAIRDELKSDINGVKFGIKSFRSEVKAIDAKPDAIDAKIDTKIESRFHDLSSQIHQIKILAEEQNAKNNIVLDGLVSLFERQERLESR